MLTLKLLRENPEIVISKLAVKTFDAREIVEKINALDQNRRALQVELDTCLAEQKKKAALIGGLMKEGKREEADAVKAEVAALKAQSAELEKKSQENNTELEALVVLLPNTPSDIVPLGNCAEDNVVVKTVQTYGQIRNCSVWTAKASPHVSQVYLPIISAKQASSGATLTMTGNITKKQTLHGGQAVF